MDAGKNGGSDRVARHMRQAPVEEGSPRQEPGTGAGFRGGPRRGSRGSVVGAAFVTAFVVLLSLPFLLLPLASGGSEGEKRDLAPWPSLTTEEGTPNLDVLSQAGAWFDDHFAFRSELVDLDATIRERLLMTSSTPNVIVGRDGWLFYAGTLDDYRRSLPLSDRALDNIAYNMSLIEEQVRTRGKGFAFTIAPNKNSLYPASMPYYELAGQGDSNLDRLKPLLEARGVNYVDLAGTLRAVSDHPLYLRRDSHWTNEGALRGFEALMAALGRDAGLFASETPVPDSSHVGDIDLMLHPTSARGEEQELWEGSLDYAYTNEATSVEDATISTRSERPDASGRLLAYRDSFGNALLPYLATSYAEATFSKMVPYDMGERMLSGADDVIIERAERHLAFFNSDPPYLAAPEREHVEPQAELTDAATLVASENGPYLVIEGDIDSALADDGSPIYITVSMSEGDEKTFEAFHVGPAADSTADSSGEAEGQALAVTDDWGYRAYVSKAMLDGRVPARARITVLHGGVLTSALVQEVSLGG